VVMALAGSTGVALRRMAPALLPVVLVAPSVAWAALDRSVWPWDPSWYGEVSVDLWSTLRLHTDTWPNAMAHAFGLKPPAVAWLGQFFVPFGGLVGGDATALLLSNLVWQALTLAFVYVALRRLAGAGAGVFAALLVGAAPLFISASHEYFAEPIQTLSIAWALLLLGSASSWPPALVLAQLPGIVAFGLLTKLSTPPYMAGPVLGALVIAYQQRARTRAARPSWQDWRVIGSAVLSVLLVIGAIGWYRVNVHQAIKHYRDASANNGLYGVAKSYPRQLVDWLEHLRDASFLSHFALVLSLLAAVALALSVYRRLRPSAHDPRTVAGLACALSLLLVLVLFATQPNQEPRYLLPLIPLLGTLAALILAWPRSQLVLGAAIAIVTVECVMTNLKSFGYLSGSRGLVVLAAPERVPDRLDALNAIVDRTCTADAAYKISMVGADYPWFNFNTLQLIAAERFGLDDRTCYYTSLGYAEADPNVAWQRVLQFDPPYYVSIDYGNPANPLPAADRPTIRPDDPFNRVNRAVYKRLTAAGRFRVVPGSRRNGFIIFKAAASPAG
jgi:4-amino-4-deoxy-L-arabinose transferase-like glycosyltransferase